MTFKKSFRLHINPIEYRKSGVENSKHLIRLRNQHIFRHCEMLFRKIAGMDSCA